MTLPILKSDASPKVVALVKEIEDRCEKWAANLALVSDFPHDTAVWGILTQIIDLIEQQIKQFGHGSQQQREAMINLGRAGARLLNEISAMKLTNSDSWLRWTSGLRESSRQAVLTSHNCENFEGCFITWHQNRRAVEVLSTNRLRFSIPQPSQMDRRIQAHQQGRRIPGWPSTVDNPVDKSFVDDSDVYRLVEQLCGKVTLEGALAIRYPDDSELLTLLRDIHYEKLGRAFRRNPAFDLGGYDLAAFRQFFAVLESICAVHEYICDFWGKRCGRYPFESAVIVKPVSEWIRIVKNLCSLNENQIRLMLSDLTFGRIRALDIYIHPFVPSHDSDRLFLIPHFIMNSRPEENILRVCSYARRGYYQPISNAKEEEMRESIKTVCPGRYSVFGPLKLPDPKLPDIDIIIKDSLASHLLIGELKWLRKPTRVIDHEEKSAELEDGFRQLRAIRSFLERSPRYLRERGILESKDGDPKLSFAVIARDYLRYSEQADDSWLAEFDAVAWTLGRSLNLTECVSKLQAFEWLPVEGRDFTAQFDSSILEGVTIESEAFYAPKASAPQ
jgi:hypothetical protein